LAGLGDLIPVKILFLYLPDQEDSQLGKATFCHTGSIRLNVKSNVFLSVELAAMLYSGI